MDHEREEDAVIEPLRQFRPQPGQEAYARMARAPWAVGAPRRTSDSALPRYLRVALVTLAVAVIAGMVVWFTPPLRSLAQDVINRLFNRAEADTQVVEINVGPPVSTVAPTTAETFRSIARAEAQTGIDIREPQLDLHPYQLTGVTVNYEMETVWLIYNAPGRYLSIAQRPAALGWLDAGIVGVSADIEAITIQAGDEFLSGEYVEGGWRVAAEPEQETAGDTVQETAVWTDESPQRRLRWQDAALIYEITAFGGGGDIPRRDLLRDDLIAIAASMY
jgi:hypothetical protein